MRCSIIQKTKTALNLFPLFILVTDEIIDENDRVVSQREYAGTGTRSDTLKSTTDFTYASKTNYLTGIKHYSPLGTQTIGYTYGNLANGQMPDQVYSVKWNGAEKVKYTYDAFGRLTGKKIDDTFRLFPPFYTDFGKNISIEKDVFINSDAIFRIREESELETGH